MSRPDEILPSDVDVIVLGTGLPESILAAAAARVGFTVLHLDRNEFYGGAWASFNLDGIIKWTEEQKNPSPISLLSPIPADLQLEDGERLIPITADSDSSPNDPGIHFSNIEMEWHIPKSPARPADDSSSEEIPPSPSSSPRVQSIVNANEAVGDESTQKTMDDERMEDPEREKDSAINNTMRSEESAKSWTQDRIMNDWRRFSLDLAPKILLGRGSMVDLLSQSNVGRYAEFRSVNRLLTFFDGALRVIPCSRSEVFQSSEVTMIEKRMLMKFLTFVLNYESDAERSKWQDWTDRPFSEFLTSPVQQLTDKLRHYILHALAMVSPSTRTLDALKSINEFLKSTGRYGNSPFLWTLYGSGELSQCFCRLCAVFGGVYCLRRTVDAWIFNADGQCTGIVSNGHRVVCRKVVTDGSYLPKELIEGKQSNRSVISRAILITDRSLTKNEGRENVSLLNYFAEHLVEPVKILESGAAGCVCPNGLYVTQMTTRGNPASTAKGDLESIVRKFFRFESSSEDGGKQQDDDARPRVLWSLYFNCTNVSISDRIADNVMVTSGLDGQLTYANLVPRLKEEFVRLWPDTDFLPAPPNPDDEADGQEAQQNDPGINGFTPDSA